jgi:hypothetical protein
LKNIKELDFLQIKKKNRQSGRCVRDATWEPMVIRNMTSDNSMSSRNNPAGLIIIVIAVTVLSTSSSKEEGNDEERVHCLSCNERRVTKTSQIWKVGAM